MNFLVLCLSSLSKNICIKFMCDNVRNFYFFDYEELGFLVMFCWFLGKSSSYVGLFFLFYVYILIGY